METRLSSGAREAPRGSAVAASKGGAWLRSLPELSIVLWGGLTSVVWELGQSPLYADHGRGLLYVLRTRLHCAGGDLLILLAAFYATSLIFRSRFWFLAKGWKPALTFITLCLAYTVWSEWFNTQVALSWEYAPAMPQISGIGLAPVAQWILVPPLVLFFARRSFAPSVASSPSAPPSRHQSPESTVDPTCGQTVATEGATQFFDGTETRHFCSAECLRAFTASWHRSRAGEPGECARTDRNGKPMATESET